MKKTTQKNKASKHLLKRALLLLGSAFFISCDFTPRMHQQILHAQSLITANRYHDAIREYQKILEGNPNSEMKMKIYYQLGELYANNLGENIKAIESFNKVSDHTVDPLWLVKAEERMADINFTYLKNYHGSFNNYQKLVLFTPRLAKHDFYEYRLALSKRHMGENDKAKLLFNEMMENIHHEFHTRSIFELGAISFQEQDWETAIKFFGEYTKKERRRDSVVQAKFLMANAHETMEDLQTAYNLYYSILGEYPNTQVIQNRLRSIYERRVARKR